jgi:hypothetical protein
LVSASTFSVTSVVVKVHQVVRDCEGNLLVDKFVIHVFQIQDGLIRRFDIRDM